MSGYLDELGSGWCVAGFTHRAPRVAVTKALLPHMQPLAAPLCGECAESVLEGRGNLSGLVVPTHLLLVDYDADKVQP